MLITMQVIDNCYKDVDTKSESPEYSNVINITLLIINRHSIKDQVFATTIHS